MNWTKRKSYQAACVAGLAIVAVSLSVVVGPTPLPAIRVAPELSIDSLALLLAVLAVVVVPRKWASVFIITPLAVVLYFVSEPTEAGVTANLAIPFVLGSLGAGVPRHWGGSLGDSMRLTYSCTFLAIFIGSDLAHAPLAWMDPSVTYEIGGAGFADMLFLGPVMATATAGIWWLVTEARDPEHIGSELLAGYRDRTDLALLVVTLLGWLLVLAPILNASPFVAS